MATVTIPAGPFPCSYLAAQDLTLANAPFYTTEFVDRVFAINAAGNYVSGKPGVSLGTTKLTAQGSQAYPNGYIFLFKKPVQVDLSLLGLAPAATGQTGQTGQADFSAANADFSPADFATT